MIEKRNFVTPLRTSDESTSIDGLVDAACGMFGPGSRKKEDLFEKNASAEDLRSDKSA